MADKIPADYQELADGLKQYKETLMQYRLEDHPYVEDLDIYCDKLELLLARVLKQVLLTQYLPEDAFKTAEEAKQYVMGVFGEDMFDRFDMTANQLKLLINAAVFDNNRTFYGRATKLLNRYFGGNF